MSCSHTVRNSILLLLALLAGCGGGDPSQQEAALARAILETREFSQPYVARLATRSPSDCEQTLNTEPEWSRWVSLGLAETSAVVRSEGRGCQLRLVEETRRELEMFKHLLSGNDGSEPLPDKIVAPLATRMLTRLVNARKSGAEIWEVDFEWHWQANRLGERLNIDHSVHAAWARLGGDDSGWRVIGLRLEH